MLYSVEYWDEKMGNIGVQCWLERWLTTCTSVSSLECVLHDLHSYLWFDVSNIFLWRIGLYRVKLTVMYFPRPAFRILRCIWTDSFVEASAVRIYNFCHVCLWTFNHSSTVAFLWNFLLLLLLHFVSTVHFCLKSDCDGKTWPFLSASRCTLR